MLFVACDAGRSCIAIHEVHDDGSFEIYTIGMMLGPCPSWNWTLRLLMFR